MKERRACTHFKMMHSTLRTALWVMALAVMTACSSESPSSANSGGMPAVTGGAGASATVGGAGSSAGGASGSTNMAGAQMLAGAGGALAGAGGMVGMSGAAGMAGSAGAGGSATHVPVPSAGCGKMNPISGSRTIMTGGVSAMYNVNVPAGYDANKPMPLGFGFHGFGNGACGPVQGECRGFAMLPAVTVYMKSISDGWEQSEVLEQNIQYFQDVLALMKNEYCIDESRIFVAGVSSGGQFIEHLTCRFGDKLWQTTAVSASVVNAANQNCKGTPPVLVIHGVTDQAGNYGQGVAEMFAKRNGCSAMAPAGLAQAKMDMMDAFNQKQAEHVCLDWDACTLNPVRFCISSQITYSGLTHGWPMVGGTLISEFQQKIQGM
jgi:poly(3-hydroxybutyrate) depolymerase